MRQDLDFFAFARERHAIYLQRRRGQPAPWTTDPTLGSVRFTNIFRELDRTTIWFRQTIRDRLARTRDVVPWCVYFRYFNRIEVGQVMADHLADTTLYGGTAHLGAELLEARIRRELPRGPWTTGAYVCFSGFVVGQDKVSGLLRFCQLFEDWWTERGQYLFFDDRDRPQLTLEQAHRALQEVYGMGGFNAYEVVADLRHAGAVNPTDRLTWAHAGPGATKGGSRVLYGEPDMLRQKNQVHQAELRDLMRLLLTMSRDRRHWPRDNPDWPAWEMREVEHTLCEFDKYERVRRWQGNAKRTFDPAAAGPLLDAGLGGL